MRPVRLAGSTVDLHGSVYTILLHRQAFGSPLSGDLDAAAEGDPAALARASWSMAATAARACGRPAPRLPEEGRARKSAALLAAVLAEAERGCYVADGARGGAAPQTRASRPADETVLALCLERGVDPASMALVSASSLAASLSGGGGARTAGSRVATPADIMRLLG